MVWRGQEAEAQTEIRQVAVGELEEEEMMARAVKLAKRTFSVEQMMEVAQKKDGMTFAAFGVDGEMHFEVTYKGKQSGPMIETELFWFLKGFLAELW